MLDDLPALAKKSGAKSDVHAPSRDDIEREIAAAEKIGAVPRAAPESAYSACLAAIDAPPPVIWIRGRRELLGREAIAMVGARDASAAGRQPWRAISQGISAPPAT